MNTCEYDPLTGHPTAIWHEARSSSRHRLSTVREISEFRQQIYFILMQSTPCGLTTPHVGDALFTTRHSAVASTVSAAVRCTNPRCISSFAP